MSKQQESEWNAADYMMKNLINRLDTVRQHMVYTKDYESAFNELVEIYKNFIGQLTTHKEFNTLKELKEDAQKAIYAYNDQLYMRRRFTKNRGIALTKAKRKATIAINEFHECMMQTMAELNMLIPMKIKDTRLAIYK